VKKTWIVFISLLAAFLLMSTGYGFWEKTLTIRGSIEVLKHGSSDTSVKSVTEVQSDLLRSESQDTIVTEEVY